MEVLNPFVFRVDPRFYPMAAAWYAKDGNVIDGLRKALREMEAVEPSPEERDRGETLYPAGKYSPLIDEFLSAEGSSIDEQDADAALKALSTINLHTRFLKEAKAQSGCAGRPLNDRMREDFSSLIKKYTPLIQPAAVISRFGFSIEGESVNISGLDRPIESKNLSRFFTSFSKRRAEQEYAPDDAESAQGPIPAHEDCYLFAATIGPGVDTEVSRLLDSGESYNALFLNAIGAAAADIVALDLELFINSREPVEGRVWRRFHTGYGDFRVDEQRRLFRLLDPACINIKLNEACIMIPEKSVSGIMAPKKRRV